VQHHRRAGGGHGTVAPPPGDRALASVRRFVGSTMLLAYAACHPRRVSQIVISGVTTTRRSEIDWPHRCPAQPQPLINPSDAASRWCLVSPASGDDPGAEVEPDITGGLSQAGAGGLPPRPRLAGSATPLPGRPAWSATSRRHGKPGTSAPLSASWTPAPPWPPIAEGWSPPPCARSRAPSRSRVLRRITGRAHDVTILERTVNGQPGLVVRLDALGVRVRHRRRPDQAHLGGAQPDSSGPDDRLTCVPALPGPLPAVRCLRRRQVRATPSTTTATSAPAIAGSSPGAPARSGAMTPHHWRARAPRAAGGAANRPPPGGLRGRERARAVRKAGLEMSQLRVVPCLQG